MIDILLNCLPKANKKSFISKSYQLLDFPWLTSSTFSLPLHVSVCLYLKYVSNLLNLQNQKKRKI